MDTQQELQNLKLFQHSELKLGWKIIAKEHTDICSHKTPR